VANRKFPKTENYVLEDFNIQVAQYLLPTKIALAFRSILGLSFWFQNRVQNRLSLAPVAHMIVACVANVVVVPKR
jgi:hypothetical protein